MHVITAQFDLIRTLDDYMDTITWRSCAGYLNRVTSVLQNDNYTLGAPDTGDDDIIDGVAIMGKMKNVAKGTNDFAAMDLAAAEEKLINPHTVSILIPSLGNYLILSQSIYYIIHADQFLTPFFSICSISQHQQCSASAIIDYLISMIV